MKTFFTFLFVILGFFSRQANAQTAAIQTTNIPWEVTLWDMFNTGNNLGWSFTVGTTPITVTALGIYDSGNDGLAEAHEVGLWTAAGILLSSTTLPSGTAAPLSAGYRYNAVTPIILAAGQTYVIGTLYTYNSGDKIIINSSQTFAPQISFVNSQRNSNGLFQVGTTPPFLFPVTIDQGDNNQAFFGPNFQFTSCVTGPLVTTNADAGPGSLRQAIIDACPGSTITFAPALNGQTIVLASTLPTITEGLTIQGPGADKLTVSGNNSVQILRITSSGPVTISGLTMANGNIQNDRGGAINVDGMGNLTVNNCAFIDNTSTRGGAIDAYTSNSGQLLTVNGCTFSGNTVISNGRGGAIYSGSNCGIINCTFNANHASFGGAIRLNNHSSIINCTITGNSAGIDGNGGAIDASCCNNYTISNSIIAGNTAGSNPDINMGINNTLLGGNNIIGVAGGGFINGVNGNQVGTASNPVNPLLAALANYGGTTQTMGLLPGSLAINAGTNSGAPATDQRGIVRPQQTTTDIGAFESQGFNINVSSGNSQSTVVSTAFTNPLSVTVTSSFNEPVDGGIVTFTPPASGASSTIAGNPATITNGSATTGIVTANGIAGPYTVTAAAGDLSTSFSLNNEAGPCADITPISCAIPATFSLSGDGIWNTATPCIDNTYGKEKIYSFTATTTGLHQVQIIARSGGSIDYSYKAASGGCSPTGWTCINADSGYPFGPLTAGVTYYILVDANQTTAISQTFQINCPVDPCLSIPTISCGTLVTSIHSGPGAWSVTACGANTPGQEKVYSFTPAVTGIYNLGITPTSGSHTIEYFYKAASDGCDATDWNCIGSTYSATSFSIGTLTGGTTYYIMLKSHGAASTSHTFKINCPAPTSAGDRVWNDTDGDGVQDGGEAGINGVTVNLKDGGGSVIATTTTAGDGNYLFSNLAAGAYSVVVVSATLPSGYSPTYDLDGTATPHTATFTLATGQTRTDVDFGYKQPPAVTCPANITVNNKTGLCGAYVTYPAAISSGNFGTLTYSIKSGSWFAVGTTNVTVKASSGASCSFTVTVKDVQKPVIVCPSNITLTAAANACTKAVNFSINAVDNCSGVVVTSVPASGSVFNVGTTTVTATATDLSGNKTTSTFTVKVKESQPPVIKVAATPIVLLWPANGSYQKINVSQFVLSVTDNCSSIPVSNVKITKVTSDEPDNASGNTDGNTTKDMKIASDCKSVDLRRERNSRGNGRVYTIYLSVTDAGGNTGTASFKVIAPVSQGGKTAVDNGSACTVSSYCSGNNYRPGAGATEEEELIVKNEIPEGFMMDQNYPNPFSSVTTIRYAIPVESKVSLGVYNQLGQRVAQLTEGKMSAGYHQVNFDATNIAGGIYLYRLLAVDADGKPVVLTKKMIVAK